MISPRCPRLTPHASRLAPHALRLTSHASRWTRSFAARPDNQPTRTSRARPSLQPARDEAIDLGPAPRATLTDFCPCAYSDRASRLSHLASGISHPHPDPASAPTSCTRPRPRRLSVRRTSARSALTPTQCPHHCTRSCRTATIASIALALALLLDGSLARSLDRSLHSHTTLALCTLHSHIQLTRRRRHARQIPRHAREALEELAPAGFLLLRDIGAWA